jgi:hypothetical protein
MPNAMKRHLLFGLVLLTLCWCQTSTAGLVPNETGFDGAVTVASEKAESGFQAVTVKMPYLDIQGKAKEGLARVVVSDKALKSGKPLPAFCHVHYELSVDNAKGWAKKGWAVFTAAYTDEKEGHPIDAAVANGYNQARAVIQWARRLPFVDRSRLHIDGGSQGGYMALVMSADNFPVTSTTADCPVVNWSYNLEYFEANKPSTKYPGKPEDSPLPFVCSVTMLAEWCFKSYGSDLSADTWYNLSPIACVDRIANPVMVVCATGDVLVPMEQMTRQPLHQPDKTRFPEGYHRDLDTLTPCAKARVTFEEKIPAAARETFVMPLQKDSFEITWAMTQGKAKKPKPGPKNQDRPWSRDKQWSLVYLDEGPPLPEASHYSHEWSVSPNTFVDHYKKTAPAPEILQAAKLEWLMRRYTRQLNDLPLLADGQPANRLNFDAVERRDIIAGLMDYAAFGQSYETRLQSLYDSCPIKPFGDHLSVDALRPLLDAALPMPAASDKKESKP